MTDADNALVQVDANQVAPVEPARQQIFNPLDADPQQFAVVLAQRSQNYDQLAQHLRDILVPDKDFGQIKGNYMLFSSGADKVLGTLGLAVNYPDEQDYRRAAMTGKSLDEIIIKAFIVDGRGQVICEGMGAAARDEHNGSLNNTLKKALKRARVDAVLRIPSVSALFESDFLAEIAKRGAPNTVNSRQRQVNPARSTGADLEVMPFGPFKDERFCDLPDSQLAWCANECKNQDVAAAARKEQQRRTGQAYRDNGGDGSDSLVEEPPVPEEYDGTPFDDDIPF